MIKAQLFAMGTQRELSSTQLTYHRTANPKTGRSGPIPMGGLITLFFASGDGDDRLLRWITHSPEGELCTLTKARIVFYAGDPDGSTLFEYQLHDAALVHWKEEFKATGTTPMTVTITISAAIQTIKGITWIKPWRESRVLSKENATHNEGVQRGISDDCGKEKDRSALEGVVLEGAKGGKELFNFTKTTLKHMNNPGRKPPVSILDDAIKSTKGLPDPQGTKALMHYTQMTRNGKLYNLEVLYDKATNTILHFQYGRGAMGPLKAIPK